VFSVDAGPAQRVDLVVGVLLRGGRPRAVDQHGVEITVGAVADVDFRRELLMASRPPRVSYSVLSVTGRFWTPIVRVGEGQSGGVASCMNAVGWSATH
jgi:hypothetical protein